jgi:hypothetical protein
VAAWPGVTVLALVILFAVNAFIDAGLQATRAYSSAAAGPVFGHLPRAAPVTRATRPAWASEVLVDAI